MKVTVAGEIMSGQMMDEIRQRAEQLRSDPSLKPRPGSLDIDLVGEHVNPRDVDRKFIEMLRAKSQVDTLPFAFPRKPGFIGHVMGVVRGYLWKLLRYQHDRMFARQNRINGWIISSLENYTQNLQMEINELKEKIRGLEQHNKDGKITGRDSK